VSACVARLKPTPVAVIAFAGGVTMMPGLQIYQALGGALQLARLGPSPEPSAVAGMLGEAGRSGQDAPLGQLAQILVAERRRGPDAGSE
jgi:hypothetical protein